MHDEFDLNGFLPYLLNRAAETTSLAFQHHYKGRYGMLRTEWRVLAHLGRYGDMTAKQIGQRAGIHKTKISRAVAALEHKRFLTRNVLADDRRHEQLGLTKAGRSAFNDLGRVAAEFDAKLMDQFMPEEAQIIKRALTRIATL